MIDIALALVANALVAGAIAFVARREGLQVEKRPWAAALTGATVRAAIAAICLFLLGLALRGGVPFARSAVAPSAWVAGACVVGGVAAGLSDAGRARLGSASPDAGVLASLRAETATSLFASLVVTLALTLFVTAASAALGVLGKPDLAPNVPLVALGLAVGVCAGAPMLADAEAGDRLAEIVVETVAAMLVAGVVWEANAPLFRRGPIVTSALGLVMLPVVLRPLFALAATAGALFAKAGPDETAAHAMSRSTHVAASLVLLVLGGTTFGALGSVWLPMFFCGACGVAAVIAWVHVAGRAKSQAAGALLLLLIGGGAALVSIAVASRSGLLRSAELGLVLCAAGAQGAALLPRSVVRASPDESTREAMAVMGSRAIGAIVIGAAVLCAVQDASCARWVAAIAAPSGDWPTALGHCENARAALASVDVARPAVLVFAIAGAALAALVKVDDTRGLALCAATLLAAGLVGRAFDSSAACLAAPVMAAIVVNAAAPATTSRATAMTVAAIGAALAPIAV